MKVSEMLDEMGTEIEFNPWDNNPERVVDGIAFTASELQTIKKAIDELEEQE